MDTAGQPTRPSLRSLSLVSVTVVGILAVALVVGLLLGSTLLSRAIHDIEQDTRGFARATAVERSLRDYHRLANLWLAAGRVPAIETARTTLESEVRATIEEVDEAASRAEERQLTTRLSDGFEAYVTERRELEARGLGLDALLVVTRPTLEQVIASADALGRYHQARLVQDHATVDGFNRALLAIATLSGALLLATLVGVAFGVRGVVLRPLSNVRKAMERFEAGELESRATEGGSREIGDIARTFNDMATTIERRRSDMLSFLAGIAHDLRNPISALKLSWQALVQRPLPIETTSLERLDRQLDRLTRMVGDLLDAVRIEAGELELELEDMDLRSTAREMVELYAPTSPAHIVALEVPEQPVEVRADPLRIEQVISNLLSNAIKYSPGGGPVTVGVAQVDGEAELAVTDRGVGIATEDLADLFVSFRRGKDTKSISAGAGLGLSVVRRIVEAHGGRIEVESALGEGSTFRVRLPLSPRTGPDQP